MEIDSCSQLIEARQRTLELISDLDGDQLMGPRLGIVNPLRWEMGHVAWFQERWILRHFYKQDPIIEKVDSLYDSAAVPHDSRWDLPLLSMEETLRYMQEVLDRVVENPPGKGEEYFFLLALYHEYMHSEAITYTRQTLGYKPPPIKIEQALFPKPDRQIESILEDVEIPGGTYLIGGTEDLPFVFDNEKWAHTVQLKSFRIARAPVTNAQFAEFVEAGGYLRQELWSKQGWEWLKQSGAEKPLYWHLESNGRWFCRRFDEVVPLQNNLPVIHVDWYEAEAYCRWAGRRLPSEAEWEVAASADIKKRRIFPWGDEPPTAERANLDWRSMECVDIDLCEAGDSVFGCRQMIGNVWEWTESDFLPYPGFTIDPYKEYSAPWFGTHKVLRGGCWATRSRLLRNTWRNFFTPDRRDIFAGFRTCAP
jgi:gamma-glutamyl hercynylcysteine S-oxide synthase